jgi:hypothetical protein
MPDYYKAWDKFGKALDELDDDENPKPSRITPADLKEPTTA